MFSNRWARAFVVGGLGTLVLSAMRVSLISRDYGGVFQTRWGLLAFIGLLGGFGGLIYTATEKWRRYEGPLRWIAYGSIGVMVATAFFLVVVTDGGEELGLASAPLREWMITWGAMAATGAVLAVATRVYLTWLGFFPD